MDKIIDKHICLPNEGDKAEGWQIERYSITSLIRVLLSRKSKGVIEEKRYKNKYRLINYMHVKRVTMSIWSFDYMLNTLHLNI